MSAPKTDLDRQASRHRGPLYGMVAVGGFVGALLLGWVFYETAGSDDATQTVPVERTPAVTAPATDAPAADAPVETAPATPEAAPEATP